MRKTPGAAVAGPVHSLPPYTYPCHSTQSRYLYGAFPEVFRFFWGCGPDRLRLFTRSGDSLISPLAVCALGAHVTPCGSGSARRASEARMLERARVRYTSALHSLSPQRLGFRDGGVVLPRPSRRHGAGPGLVAGQPRLLRRERAYPFRVAARRAQHAYLQSRAFLEKAGRDRRRAHVLARRGDAVAAHHHRDALPETRGHVIAQLARADQPDAPVFGYAIRERPALVVHDAMRLPDLREGDAGERVRVADAVHVRPRRVDARVYPELAVRRALAGQDFSVRIDDEKAILVGEPRAAPGRNVERTGPRDPRAHMPIGGRQPETLHDAIRHRHIVAQVLVVTHDLLPLRCPGIVASTLSP